MGRCLPCQCCSETGKDEDGNDCVCCDGLGCIPLLDEPEDEQPTPDNRPSRREKIAGIAGAVFAAISFDFTISLLLHGHTLLTAFR